MEKHSAPKTRVLAVVVTHQGEPWLRESLRSLAAQDHEPLDVIVVDNASSFGVDEVVAEELPDAEFVRSDSNLGFGAAANRALEVSRASRHADYFLFTHDDVVLEEGAISALVTTARSTRAGAVGGKGHSWDDPDLLVEVGMSADQFGYPYTGLEEGEIDQGQHEQARDVLYVSTACILVDRKLIEHVGSWDGGFFAFAEDLDMCLRARLAGFKILVEPEASYRHALALAEGIRQTDASSEVRFLTRRNRLRTVIKTVSGVRLLPVVLLYLGINLAEMLILLTMRRYQDLGAYPRGIASFIATLPGTLRRRRAVQKRRKVSDRKIRALMVSDLSRARTFLERRFREWEYETVQFGVEAISRFTPAYIKEKTRELMRLPLTLPYLILGSILIWAMRDALTAGVMASGSSWPLPEDPGTLLSTFVSGWRDVGLGTESAAPPVLFLAWLASLVTFGARGLTLAAIFLGLTTVGLVSADRVAKKRSTYPGSRAAAVFTYAFLGVLAMSTSEADLGALALFAAGPRILDLILRMMGSTPGDEGDVPGTPPTTDGLSRDALKLALIIALVVAIGPSVAIGILIPAAIIVGLSWRSSWDRLEARRRAGWVFGSVPLGLLMLVPWTFEAMRPTGAILGPITSGLGGGGLFGPIWSAVSPLNQVFLTPAGGWGPQLAVTALIVGSLLLPREGRRREVRTLVTMWMGMVAIGIMASMGLLPVPVASPATWLVIPTAGASLIAAHLIAGIREEMGRYSLGWRQALIALGGVIVAVAALGWWLPQASSWGEPDSTLAGATDERSRSLQSFFVSTAEQLGDFRVLWLGPEWIDPIRPGMRAQRGQPFLVTGPEGLSLLESQMPPRAAGEERLDSLIDSLLGRRLHLAGHLLAPSGIRYVVVNVDDDAALGALGRQRDLALQQQSAGVAIFQNLSWIPRAVLAPPELAVAASREVEGDIDLMIADWIGGRAVPESEQAHFRMGLPRTTHQVLLLGDNFNPDWRARIGEDELEHSVAFGWSNAWEVPVEAEGLLELRFMGRWKRVAWLLFQAVVVTVVVGAISIGKVEIRGRLR